MKHRRLKRQQADRSACSTPREICYQGLFKHTCVCGLVVEAVGIRQALRDLHLHVSAYVSIRQHTSAYVSIRQHTSAFVSIRPHTSAYGSIRQHTSACVSIRQHTSVYVSMRQHTAAYVSIRQQSASCRRCSAGTRVS